MTSVIFLCYCVSKFQTMSQTDRRISRGVFRICAWDADHIHKYLTFTVINPRRMREGYGTWFVVRSFVHSFCPSSCRDHRTLLKLGKGVNRLSTTMACNVTRGFC